MPKTKTKPIIMVSSAVYGFEELLDRIYATLSSPELGYEVWMSHAGTLPVDPTVTALRFNDNGRPAPLHPYRQEATAMNRDRITTFRGGAAAPKTRTAGHVEFTASLNHDINTTCID